MAQNSWTNLIFILLHADDVALFSCSVDAMQNLLGVFKTFYQICELIIRVDKTKMMAIQPRNYPTFIYRGELIQMA